MQDLIKLIREDAQDVSDASGKTQLDSEIEAWATDQPHDLVALLQQVVPHLSEDNWKEWRAFRQIVGRLKIKNEPLRNELAVLTEVSRPTDSRARFYTYLARLDLGDPPSMDELIEDDQLRNQRPGDWLQLALNQASPLTLRAQVIKMAGKLKATDFAFKIVPFREKYGENFVEWMTELCLAMPFTEALELANLIDDEYNCGIHSEVLIHHPKLRGNPSPRVEVQLWDGLNDQFKTSVLEKAQ